ncbi:MAG: hypothetical protein PHO92_03730 [Candidatus Peribacteraceae bacterium]|nr:hypothetical protein [Candidatus Peribacteraceae bacterium]
MQQTCRNPWCKQSFEVTDDDLAFYDQVSPVFAGKKYSLPPPSLCPDCRQQRRLSFCNEFNLYPGTCDLCKKRTLTQFPSKSGIPYYCRECWHSDQWNALSYGRDFDFNRPFFEQLSELKRSVPSLALDVQGELQNCDYIHYAGSSKNCYLIMHADFCEDCMYGYGFKHDRSCMDGFYNLQCELLYDCVDCHSSYGLTHCQDCINCHSSAFLRDCIGCKSCFLCAGLRNKEFCFENEQLTKDEYQKRMQSIDLGSYAQYQQYAMRRGEIETKHPFKEFHGHNTENCSGDYLSNCKDTHASFDCENVERAKFCYQTVTGAKNLYDIYQYGLQLQESLECTISGENSYHLLFTLGGNVSCSNLLYCWYMENSKNCFGCVNMKHASYCILNKQYSKEEYEKLVPKIIEHMRKNSEWGEFLPTPTSLFGYNKTSAQVYYPLSAADARERGWQWDVEEAPPPDVKKTIDAKMLPDNQKDIPDDILNWAIRCEITGRPFKIQPQELAFYRQQNLPIPRHHWYQRHLDRFHLRNPRRFWKRTCAKCKKEIRTTYAPERPEIVFCEECYLKEVY